MSSKVINLAVYILLIEYANVVYCDCHLSFPRLNDTKQPLILTNDSTSYKFLLPVNGTLNLTRDELIGLSCPELHEPSEQVMRWARCIDDNNFQIQNTVYEFDDLECESVIRGNIRITNVTCGNNLGKILIVGYELNNHQWIPIIKVCHNIAEVNTLYAEHLLYSQAIGAISKQQHRPPFRQDGIELNSSVNTLYTQKKQMSTFTKILGSSTLANKYLTYNKSFLARGHLTPKADMIYASWQTSTRFFINVSPQWQAVNGGNWQKIESHIRRVARNYKESLRIFTGNYGVFSLPDINGEMKEIYLQEDKKIPVPKFLWKIIYSSQTEKGIAFVLLNNPFIKDVLPEDVLCKNLCVWKVQRLQAGYFYCCDIRDLRRYVTIMPTLRVKGILDDFVLTSNVSIKTQKQENISNKSTIYNAEGVIGKIIINLNKS